MDLGLDLEWRLVGSVMGGERETVLTELGLEIDVGQTV